MKCYCPECYELELGTPSPPPQDEEYDEPDFPEFSDDEITCTPSNIIDPTDKETTCRK